MGTSGSTITNTATVDFLSQIDPDVSDDASSVDITVAGLPSLLILKSVSVIEDPFNGTSNPKAIPGSTVQYLVSTTNSGSGTVDVDSLIVTDPIPANAALRVTDFDGSTPGPIRMGRRVSGQRSELHLRIPG